MTLKDKIKKGDEVKYLGITYVVNQVAPEFVSIIRRNGSQEIFVMAGSSRFRSIFKGVLADDKAPFQFNTQELRIDDELGARGKVLFKHDKTPRYAEKSTYTALFNKYCIETTLFESDKDALAEVVKDIKADATAETLLFFTTYAYQKSATKFEFLKVATAVNSLSTEGRPQRADEALVEFFLASLSDVEPASELEIRNLAKKLPLELTAEALSLICAFDFKREDGTTLILNPKRIQRLLKEMKDTPAPVESELQARAESLDELE